MWVILTAFYTERAHSSRACSFPACAFLSFYVKQPRTELCQGNRMLSYLLPFYTFLPFEITIDSHAVGRNSTERSYILLSNFSQCQVILHNDHDQDTDTGVTHWPYSDFTHFACTCVCVYLVLYSPILHTHVYVYLDPSCYLFILLCNKGSYFRRIFTPGITEGFFQTWQSTQLYYPCCLSFSLMS